MEENNMKKLTTFVCLLLCLAALLCACGPAAPSTTNKAPVTTKAPETTKAPATTAAPSTDVTYTATVVDQDGKPMAGVVIQFCDDANICKLPVTTNAEGKVTVTYAPANYHVSVTVVPEGYTAEADGYYFEKGSTEITVKLTKN